LGKSAKLRAARFRPDLLKYAERAQRRAERAWGAEGAAALDVLARQHASLIAALGRGEQDVDQLPRAA
jgi:hypothetical protein